MGGRQIVAASGAVVRARVRTAGEVGAARLRAAAVIGAADLRAPSLPPSAVLCVRRVHVPAAIGSPLRAADKGDFDRALHAALDEVARRARRPAVDTTVSCDAVVFDDEAELLACLARDWRAGHAADRWWWRTLFRERIALDLVVQTWTDAPSLIVPAIERLAEWREAAGFASVLGPGHVRQLVSAMVQAHGGPPAADLIVDRAPATPAAIASPRTGTETVLRVAEAVMPLARRYSAADTATPMRGDQRALLGVAAVVRCDAPLLRQAAFTEAFRVAMRALDAAGAASSPIRLSPMEAGREWDRPGSRPLDVRHDDERCVGSATPPGEIPTAVDAAVGDSRPEVRTAPRPIDNHRAVLSDRAGTSPVQPSAALIGAESTSFPQFVDTPLGGVFYLLNVAIALRLYGDFTMPRRRGLRLSPWDLLALTAAHWRGEPLDRDTTRLLAQLAGRSPGGPPGDRTIPAGRLARWMPRLVRRINRWVAASLGEAAEEDLANRLLCHQARVHVTPAHVDVTFDLSSLPIEIRLAGLDRDPGWIPAAGRIVRFHYS